LNDRKSFFDAFLKTILRFTGLKEKLAGGPAAL
jgi:hypothetical protein